ncbi:MAG: PH domain-containing protein [Nanoarchaeota archaeon]|nr:PH domain-containing protein [Nanoarchaeota archaeon]
MSNESIYGIDMIKGEEIVDSFHPLFLRFFWHYIISLLLIALGILAYYYEYDILGLSLEPFVYLLYLSGAGIVWLILTIIANKAELFVITTHRLIYKKGLFNINTLDVDVDKIQNTKVHQSLIERIFNYGTFSVDTSGSEGYEIVFSGMPSISRKRAIVKSLIEQDLDAVKERKKRVEVEKKLESKEKVLDKLKKDIKDLEVVITKEKK